MTLQKMTSILPVAV